MAPTDTALGASTLLQLMWLASPGLPVGGFSYSEGLEAAVDAGLVGDEDGARCWLLDQLWLGLARSELPLVVQAAAAWHVRDFDRVRALNDWLLSTRETAEARLQTEQMGRSLAGWLAQRPATDRQALQALNALQPAPGYPVAFALAAAGTGAPPRDAALAYAFGWAENMVQSSVKSVPLGQSAGQRTLGALAAAIPEAVEHALSMPDEGRVAALPGLAILGARHETQYSRLFRS